MTGKCISKRLLALLLCLALCLSMVPAVYADDGLIVLEGEDEEEPVPMILLEGEPDPEPEPEPEPEPGEEPEATPDEEPADDPEAGGGGQITIRFDGNGGEGWTNSLYYYYGDEVYAPECGFTRAYYNFIGWGVDPEGPPMFLPGAPLDISESMTFYAIWEAMTQEELDELYAPKSVSVWSQGFLVDPNTDVIYTRAELRWNKVDGVEDFAVSMRLGAPDGPLVPGTSGFNISEAEVYWSSCYVWISAPFLDDGTEQKVTDGAVNGLLNGDVVYATLASVVNGTTCPGNTVSFTVEKPDVEQSDDPLVWFVLSGSGNVEYDDYGTATVTLVKDTVLPAEGFKLEQGTEVHIQMNTHTLTGTMIDTAGTPLFIQHLTSDGPVMALYNYAGAELAFNGYGWMNGSGATAGSVTVTFTDKGQLVNDSTYSKLTVTNGVVVTDNPWTLEDVQRWGYVNTQEPVTYEMGRLTDAELAQHIPQDVEVTPLETGLAVSWETDPEATEAEIYVDVILDDGTVAHVVGGSTVCAPGHGPESYCWLESGGFNYATVATTMLGVDEEQIYTDGYVNGILPNQTLIVTVTHLVGPFWQETPKSTPVSFKYTTGNFGKTFNASGLVNRQSLADGGTLKIISSLEGLIYNGQGQTLDYSVLWNGKTLTKGKDYVGRYSNYVGPGTATLTVIALRPYAGALSQSYTISAIDLASDAVTVSFPEDLVYNGSSQTPEPTITCNGYTLKSGSDYNVSYSDYTNAGEATATITPGYRNTCVGRRVAHFTIAPRSMTSANLKAMLTADRWAWTGEPITPGVTVKWGSKALNEGTDYTVAYYNNTDPGTARVVVTGVGNYAGTRTLEFEIYERADLSVEAVIDPIPFCVYDRTAHTPEPVVHVGQKLLRRGLDYSVSYENNVSAGTATVTVTGNGRYTGEASVNFDIDPASLEGCTMTVGRENYPYNTDTHVYDGHEFRPSAKIMTADGYELYVGSSFTLSYANNVNVGEAQVIATGMGNYEGTLTGTFTIDPMAIETVRTNIENPYYSGQAQEPTVRLYNYYYNEQGNQKTRYLTEGVDYEILGCANNVNAGEATVTIRGLGNYSGEHAFTFNVTPMPVNLERDFTLTYDKTVLYTGSPVDIHIRVKWKLDGRTLVEGTDYTVQYWGKDYEEGNRTDICDNCSARITFCGNFSGSYSEVYFAIVEPGAVELPVNGLYSGTYWNIDAEGTLTVWGDGATADLSYHDDVAWRPYRSQIKKIVVLQGITKLTAGTFADCRFAAEIELPDGLTEISYSVFTGCDRLQKINIPTTVTKLHGSTFPDVAGLEIHLPDNISKDNLESYPSLNKAKLFVKRGSVTDTAICQTYAYFYYEGYPDWMLSYSQNSDQGLVCWKYVGSESDVRVPDFVDGLNGTFAGSYLVERVVVPANVRTMGYGNMMPFENCYGLRELVIEPGDKLTELRSYSFYGCSDLTVYIPDTITSIGQIIQSDYTNILFVANCDSYAIEWAKGQMRWGSPIWYPEEDAESGPRYRALHERVHHEGQAATCEQPGWTEYDTCTRCDYTSYTELPALGHDWGEPAYRWADDYSELAASRACVRDPSHVETETVAVTARISIRPTCTEPGETTYTSARFENPAFHRQSFSLRNVPATGHVWGEPTWTWAEDYRAATATFTCKNDPSHIVELAATVTSETTDPQIGVEGRIVYTAKVTLGEKEYTDEKTVAIPALDGFTAPVLTEAFNSATGVRVSWKPVHDAVKYQLLRKNLTIGEKQWHVVGETTECTLIDKTVKSASRYTFTVRPINAKGEEGPIDETGRTCTYIAKADITDITVTAEGVSLKWSKPAGAKNFRVMRRVDGVAKWTVLDVVLGTEYLDTTAEKGVKYWYTVRGVSMDNTVLINSYNGTGWSMKPLETPVLTEAFNSATGVRVSWKPNEGAVKYRLLRKNITKNETEWSTIAETTELTFIDTSAVSASRYTYTVECVDSNGRICSAQGNPRTCTYIAMAKITALGNVSTGVKIVWSKPAGAKNFRVFRKTEGGQWEAIADVQGTNYIDKTAQKGVKYWYTVRAISMDGKMYINSYNSFGWSVTRK
ncbi:MAG: leucine-rich repeat protein [Oscillospiraceae bacterium]|nr:leucine-rich repeat protein [Oscillospiraceae bacterium]